MRQLESRDPTPVIKVLRVTMTPEDTSDVKVLGEAVPRKETWNPCWMTV